MAAQERLHTPFASAWLVRAVANRCSVCTPTVAAQGAGRRHSLVLHSPQRLAGPHPPAPPADEADGGAQVGRVRSLAEGHSGWPALFDVADLTGDRCGAPFPPALCLVLCRSARSSAGTSPAAAAGGPRPGLAGGLHGAAASRAAAPAPATRSLAQRLCVLVFTDCASSLASTPAPARTHPTPVRMAWLARRERLYGEMEQLRGDGLTPPLATYVFGRLLAEGRRAELLDLPAQVGRAAGCGPSFSLAVSRWIIRSAGRPPAGGGEPWRAVWRSHARRSHALPCPLWPSGVVPLGGRRCAGLLSRWH